MKGGVIIEDINKRLEKAEQLQESERNKHLFKYLELRALKNENKKLDMFYIILVYVTSSMSEQKYINIDDLTKFIEDMDKFIKKTNNIDFAYSILSELIMYNNEIWKRSF